MAKKNQESQVQHPLKWPDGWTRTLIGVRKSAAGWKKSTPIYVDLLTKELGRMGVADLLITYNPSPSDRQDPGVAVYFSLGGRDDYSWQTALGLDTPAPTIQQIEQAYRALAMQHHPDRGGDIETFKALTRHRDNAKRWVQGIDLKEHEFVIPCDKFNEVRLNIAAIKKAATAMRALDSVGIPGMLERSFRGFRTALTAGASTKEANEQPVTA